MAAYGAPRGRPGALARVLPRAGTALLGRALSVPFLDLSRQVAATRREVETAIAAVLDRGRFVLGPVVEDFEAAFAAYCGARFCVGVASGTDALSIALGAAGVRAG